MCGSRVRGGVAGKDFPERNLNRVFKDEPSFNGHSEDECHSPEGDYEQVFKEVGWKGGRLLSNLARRLKRNN